MFVKITRSGPRSYVKLVESFRDDQGVPRQRVIATLGRLEAVQAGGAAALIAGLQRVSGSAVPDEPADSTGPVVNFATALSVGDTWLLSALWQRLGLAAGLHRVLRNSRSPVQAEALLRVMVFNRLCQPCSKLGVMRWLEGVQIQPRPTQADDGACGVNLYRANVFARLLHPRERIAHAPVQVIVPLRDHFVSPALSENLHRWAPGYVRRELDAGHWVTVQAPHRFADAVLDFIDHLPATEAKPLRTARA